MTDQRADDAEFNDLNRFGRWNHAAITAGGVFYDLPAQLALTLLGLLPRVEGSDRFGRMPHSGIVCAHHGLSHQADDGHLQTRC